jgi:cytochrome c oxidase subunit 2
MAEPACGMKFMSELPTRDNCCGDVKPPPLPSSDFAGILQGGEDNPMVKTKSFLAALVPLAFLAIPAFAQAPAAATDVHEIQMAAKKYEFDPNVITVKKGEHVKLIITALDHDHGFDLEAFGINQRLKKGEPTTIEFTADKAGTFEFKCSVFCGLGHRKMKGKLVVEGQ